MTISSSPSARNLPLKSCLECGQTFVTFIHNNGEHNFFDWIQSGRSYDQMDREAEARMAAGHRQKKCKSCGLWRWPMDDQRLHRTNSSHL